MKTLGTLLIALAFQAIAFSQNTTSLLDAYLEVKDALIESDGVKANTRSTAFLQAIEKEASFAQRAGLIRSVQKMAKTTDVAKQRTAFAEVSPLMWQVIKSAKTNGRTIYYHYCPMKKAYWLSQEAVIKNPYYGSAMLNCGSLSEKITD